MAKGKPSFTILPPPSAGLPGFSFDSFDPIEHTSSLTIAKHPLELGSKAADHVIEEKPGFSVQGFISRTPIRATIYDATQPGQPIGGILQFPGAQDFPKAAWELLEKYKDGRLFLTITAGSKLYTDMILKEIKPRDEAGGIHFSLAFEAVKTVSSSQVKAPAPLEPKAAPKVSQGQQTPGQPNPVNKQNLQSFAVKFLDKAFP